ncbi:MAG: beta-lactamase family protein [Lachnospiraceae bacterium]|nr:beta-lactamase family protein [Lachnospiraceae bacterium]
MDIRKRMADYHIPGVSVTYFKDGKIKWNNGYGELKKDTSNSVNEHSIFHACSISKMVTALCTLKLVETGILDLWVEANKYLTTWKIPDNEFTEKKSITLAHLLSHQAGFYDIDGSFEPYQDGDPIPTNMDILKGVTKYNREEVQAKYVPESNHSYSDAGFCVIEQVLKDTTGKNIVQLAEEYVFAPLQLKRTFFWEIGKGLSTKYDIVDCAVGHDCNGEIVNGQRAHYPNVGGAALWSTSKELSVLALDIVKSYHDGTGIILSQDMAQRMLTPCLGKNYVGLGVFLGEDQGQPYFMSQGWGVGMQCKLKVYYKEQRGITVMTNSDPGMEQDRSLIGEIIQEATDYHENKKR